MLRILEVECIFRDSMVYSPIPILCNDFIYCYYKMTIMICPFLPVHLLLHFLVAMNASKHTPFKIWYNENVLTNKFSAVEAHVFHNIILKNSFCEK